MGFQFKEWSGSDGLHKQLIKGGQWLALAAVDVEYAASVSSVN